MSLRKQAIQRESSKALSKIDSSSPSTSRRRQSEVLDEDEYTEALSYIIRRDFFPQLHENKKRNEEEAATLEGMLRDEMRGEKSDRITHSSRKRVTESVGGTPFRTEGTPAWEKDGTPIRQNSTSTPKGKEPSASSQHISQDSKKSLNLTSFLSKYTSEDNSSFADIIERVNAKQRSKYAWAYEKECEINEAEKESRMRRLKLIEMVTHAAEQGQGLKMIEGAEPGNPGGRMFIEAPENRKTLVAGDAASLENVRQKMITGTTSSDGQKLIGGPPDSSDHSESLTTEENEVSTGELKGGDGQSVVPHPATSDRVELWPFKTKNSLYFSPDADVESRGSMLPPAGGKTINRGNTQFPGTKSEALESIPSSPSSSYIAAAVNGDTKGLGTPRVRGYGFVDEMPSPSPSSLGEGGMKQLMTQGKLAAAPVPLQTVSNEEEDRQPSGSFRIAATPRRELLAHRMVSESKRRKTDKMKQEDSTPRRLVGRSTPARREASMTPAARRLLDATRTPHRQ